MLRLAQVLVGQDVWRELDPGPGGLPRWILPCRRSSGRVPGLGPGKGEVDRPILEDRLVGVKDQQEVSIALDLAHGHAVGSGQDTQLVSRQGVAGNALIIGKVPRGAAAGALPAPVGAGGIRGFDKEGGRQEVERFSGPVVSGEVEPPDVEGPALVGLELVIFLGGVLFLQDVAGGGVAGDDAGRSLQLDALAVRTSAEAAGTRAAREQASHRVRVESGFMGEPPNGKA